MCVFNFFFLLLVIIRPEDTAVYSPKRSTKAENKDGQPIEESEILISKAPQKTREPSLFLALCRTFGPYFLISFVYKIIHDILMFAGPEILRLLSLFFPHSPSLRRTDVRFPSQRAVFRGLRGKTSPPRAQLRPSGRDRCRVCLSMPEVHRVTNRPGRVSY